MGLSADGGGLLPRADAGQYDKINPINIIARSAGSWTSLWLLVKGVADAFNWVYMFFAAAAVFVFLQDEDGGNGTG
jgi:hypothetical protein